MCFFFFFFSSRRRHTRLTCDWSSDVCSSDLGGRRGESAAPRPVEDMAGARGGADSRAAAVAVARPDARGLDDRSEERRVGKEGRARWGGCYLKKKEERCRGG